MIMTTRSSIRVKPFSSLLRRLRSAFNIRTAPLWGFTVAPGVSEEIGEVPEP